MDEHPIQMIRVRALARGDVSLVAECDAQLIRLGIYEAAIPAEMETAVPVKRKPGRPRKVLDA